MISPSKGALVRIEDAQASGARGFVFQYNPSDLRRKLEPSRDGAPREEISLELVLDATVDDSATGLRPQLAALDSLLHPALGEQPGPFARLFGAQARPGVPLALLLWGHNRTVPVRMLQLAVTEEIFDPALTVLRATVRVQMAVATEAEVAGNRAARDHLRRYHLVNAEHATEGLSDLPPVTG